MSDINTSYNESNIKIQESSFTINELNKNTSVSKNILKTDNIKKPIISESKKKIIIKFL